MLRHVPFLAAQFFFKLRLQAFTLPSFSEEWTDLTYAYSGHSDVSLGPPEAIGLGYSLQTVVYLRILFLSQV